MDTRRPIDAYLRGWVAQQWPEVQSATWMQGEWTMCFKSGPSPSPVRVGFAHTSIPFVPPEQLQSAFEKSERGRQALEREVATIRAENERLNAILKNRLKLARKHGKEGGRRHEK